MMRSILGLFLLSAMVIASVGCGQPGPKLYTIKGTVKHKGKPVEGLLIQFTPTDQGTKAEAMGGTDKNGRFEMKIGDLYGVYPGEHTVTASDPLVSMGVGKTSTAPEYLAVIQKYSVGKSPIKMDIKKNESNLELNLD